MSLDHIDQTSIRIMDALYTQAVSKVENNESAIIKEFKKLVAKAGKLGIHIQWHEAQEYIEEHIKQ